MFDTFSSEEPQHIEAVTKDKKGITKIKTRCFAQTKPDEQRDKKNNIILFSQTWLTRLSWS